MRQQHNHQAMQTRARSIAKHLQHDDNFPSAEDGPDAGPGQPTTRWKLAYSTLFYAGLGLEPFFDVLWTTANQTGHAYPTNRSNIELQAMVSALAALQVFHPLRSVDRFLKNELIFIIIKL